MSLDEEDSAPDPPVEPVEFLLRHFPSDPGEYDFTKKYPRSSIFHPRKSDTDGLSLNREGPRYVSAEQLRQSSENPRIREYGRVLAILAGAITALNLTIEIKPGTNPGHVIVPEISITIYNRSDQDKKVIKELKDKLVRLAATEPPQLVIRIHPTPRPVGS